MFGTYRPNSVVRDNVGNSVTLSGCTHQAGNHQHDAMLGAAFPKGALGANPMKSVFNQIDTIVQGTSRSEYNTATTLTAAHLGLSSRGNVILTIGWAGDSPIELMFRHPGTGEILRLGGEEIGFESHKGPDGHSTYCFIPGAKIQVSIREVDLTEMVGRIGRQWGVAPGAIEFSVMPQSDGLDAARDCTFLGYRDQESAYLKRLQTNSNFRSSPANYLVGGAMDELYGSYPEHIGKDHQDNITVVATSFGTLHQYAETLQTQEIFLAVADGVSTPVKNDRPRGHELSAMVIRKIHSIIKPYVPEETAKLSELTVEGPETQAHRAARDGVDQLPEPEIDFFYVIASDAAAPTVPARPPTMRGTSNKPIDPAEYERENVLYYAPSDAAASTLPARSPLTIRLASPRRSREREHAILLSPPDAHSIATPASPTAVPPQQPASPLSRTRGPYGDAERRAAELPENVPDHIRGPHADHVRTNMRQRQNRATVEPQS